MKQRLVDCVSIYGVNGVGSNVLSDTLESCSNIVM